MASWTRCAKSCSRPAAIVVVMMCLLGAATARGAPRDTRLATVHTWAFAIGNGDLRGDLVRRYAAYDLLVLDGQSARASQVAALKAAGKIVLGYLDVGTIEPFRPWFSLLKPYRLAYWSAWGEWYAAVAVPGYRRAITRRIAPRILAKGFDGLFLDNTDMIESHPGQIAGMRALVRGLSKLIHPRGGLLFTQNGEDSIGPMLAYYDGWNREDVSHTYDFSRHRYVKQPAGEIRAAQRALRRIAARGLLVLATDYTARASGPSTSLATADACAAGALPFVSDINLTRIPAAGLTCP